jgi:hypothetical protein
MLHAVIAKKLVKEDPALLLPTNESKLRDAIEAIYERDQHRARNRRPIG